MHLNEFWAQALRRLHDELSEQQFNLAISPITVGEVEGAWAIYARNQFALNLLRSQYSTKLNALRDEIAPQSPVLVFKVGMGETVVMAEKNEVVDNHHHPLMQENEPTEAATENDCIPVVKPMGKFTPELPLPDLETPEQYTLKLKKPTAQDILAQRMNNLRPNRQVEPEQRGENSTGKSAIEQEREREEEQMRHTQTNLSPDYTFETLVEGKGNHLAAAIAKSIAEAPGDSMYNPFFVYGSTGLGKTHLVQAVGNELLRLNAKARVRYMHSDEYLKTFMATVRNKTWDTFKQQYLHYQLLIIDDIQFIAGKDRTMEEFFFLFEHFHSRDQQIILTCDQLPSSLENMDKRLISRFSWGMTIRLEPPELEMRVDILERKAQAVGVTFKEDAALFIAQNVKQNVRELEGALNRVLARCRFEKRQIIDIDIATQALQDIVESNYKPINPELIIKAVADHYHITIREILGKRRSRNLARPRQMAMALTKELTNLSLPAIGDAFGGRDHTTVMHAIKTISKLRQEDMELKQDYDRLLIVIQH